MRGFPRNMEEAEAFMDDLDRRIELLYFSKERLVDLVRELEDKLDATGNR